MKNRKFNNTSGHSLPWLSSDYKKKYNKNQSSNQNQNQCQNSNRSQLQNGNRRIPTNGVPVIRPLQAEIPSPCLNTDLLPPHDPALDDVPFEVAVTEYTNRVRAAIGIPPLTLDPLLTFVAFTKANEMAQQQYYSHVNPFTGRTPQQMAVDLGFWTNCVAENIHYTPATAYDVFVGWFCSPGHFENMTNPLFDVTGVGFAQGEPYETVNGFTFPNNKWAALFASTIDEGEFNCF